MSSIWGYFSSDKSYTGTDLSIWNKVYGTTGSTKEIDNIGYVGGCQSFITSHPVQADFILSSGDFVGIADAIIYNRDEIIRELGASSALSDEMLIFQLIIEKGADALSHVNGDFAGAICNKSTRSVTLFRDHFGVRPLFYYLDKNSLVFSTDVRGILSVKNLCITINGEWAYKTLVGNFLTDASSTEYNNVFRVKPSTYITINMESNGFAASEKTYWAPASKKIRFLSQKKYRIRMRQLIENSIKMRLDAIPGKIGSELSGGLDSSVISVLINRFNRDGVYYSWSRSPEKKPIVYSDDERIIINSICEREKIRVQYNDLHSGEWLNVFSEKSKSLGLYDDSDSNFSFPPYLNTLPLFITGNVIKASGSNVVFSGHGGDEGVSHRSHSYELLYHHDYYHYLRFHFAKTHGQKNRIKGTIKRIKNNLADARNDLLQPFVYHNSAEDFISADLQNKSKDYYMSPLYFKYDPLKYIRQGHMTLRPECAAVFGAYAGVQYIFPFLDYRVMDYALSIPRYCYLNKGRSRYVYKEAFKDILPEKLYRNTPKEESSHKSESVNEDFDWFPYFDKMRNDTVAEFDTAVWENILSADKIKAWAASGRPADSEKDVNIGILDTLESLLQAQTCLTGSRLAVERAKEKEQASQPAESE